MAVAGFDHVAVPTARPGELISFYHALGFEVPDPESLERARVPAFEIRFGSGKINVHLPALWQDARFTLRGSTARPGCADLCFVWESTEADLRTRLAHAGADVEFGPVHMHGARGPAVSLYTRDPDGNLLEFMFYDPARVTTEVEHASQILQQRTR